MAGIQNDVGGMQSTEKEDRGEGDRDGGRE